MKTARQDFTIRISEILCLVYVETKETYFNYKWKREESEFGMNMNEGGLRV